MKRAYLIIALVAFAVAVLSGCPDSATVSDSNSPDPTTRPDNLDPAVSTKQAPGFELVDVNGRTHALSEYRGDVVVMYFWATYCVPCCEKLEKMQAMHEAYGPRGVQFLALSLDPTAEIVAGWEQEHDVDFPLIALEADENKPQQIRNKYFPEKKIIALPQGIIINPQGDIVWAMGSELTLEDLEEAIKSELQKAGR